MGWTYPAFEIPHEVYEEMSAVDAGVAAEADWNDAFAAYEKAFPAEAASYKRRMAGEMPVDFSDKLKAYIADTAKAQEEMPVRMASHKANHHDRQGTAGTDRRFCRPCLLMPVHLGRLRSHFR